MHKRRDDPPHRVAARLTPKIPVMRAADRSISHRSTNADRRCRRGWGTSPAV
jgi:hypothetical protein